MPTETNSNAYSTHMNFFSYKKTLILNTIEYYNAIKKQNYCNKVHIKCKVKLFEYKGIVSNKLWENPKNVLRENWKSYQ